MEVQTKQQRMEKRGRIVKAMRAFFDGQDFLSVETPTIVQSPGMEPNLEPVKVGFTLAGKSYYGALITSPEYSMKKLLAQGYEKIYEIARVYRGGEPDGGHHNTEFTMIEWYRANADYMAIMDDVEKMVSSVAEEVCGSQKISYQGKTIDLAGPWERLTVHDAFERYAGIDLAKGIDAPESFVAECVRVGAANEDDTFEDSFFKVFLRDIEPKLGQGKPTILYEYPASMAALSVLKKADKRFAERFEVYIAGIELCNAFTELTDGEEQRVRLLAEQIERKELGRQVFPIDEDFLDAVSKMPPSGGVALGVDRLVMLLTNTADIRDVLFFPTAKLFK